MGPRRDTAGPVFPGSGPDTDRGSVTIEAALAVGTLVAVLAVILAAMAATVLQLRCVDAATEAARFAARDDPDGARRAAGRLVPEGTEILVERQGDDVVARVRAAPLGSALPGVRVSAQAVAAREPSSIAPGEASTDPTDPTDTTDPTDPTDTGLPASTGDPPSGGRPTGEVLPVPPGGSP